MGNCYSSEKSWNCIEKISTEHCPFYYDTGALSCIPVGMTKMGLIKTDQSTFVVDERRYNAWYEWSRNVISPPREIWVMFHYGIVLYLKLTATGASTSTIKVID
jgi:hypothetical protein